MRSSRPANENYRDFPKQGTFTREIAKNPGEVKKGNLPNPVGPTFSRHFGNEYKMNSPGDIGDQSSAFTGMYETDANYRWRKVRGNLDLFVMERNERHLTSLQWKWQKMPKSRRRTPVYENQESNYTPYWPGKHRYGPGYPPKEPGYPNYDYVPDFPNQYRPAYPHQPPPHEYNPHFGQMPGNDNNMSAVNMYPNQRDVDPWMKKDISPHHYAAKNLYEEEIKFEEQRKKNEETTKKLQKEQQEMEVELQNLQKMLNAEMRRQEDSNCINEHFNDKIDNIERQIAEMDAKLTDTAGKLKQNEIEKEELCNRLSCVGEGDIPLNAPLFIISDPQNGTAAALAQGSYQDYNQESSTRRSNYFDQSHFNSSELPRYVIHAEQEEQTQQEQQHLKAELEFQMATLKAELEQQLREQSSIAESNTNIVIDVRVSNLEKQIEEMREKIRQAENEIKKAEEERKNKPETKSPKEKKSTPKLTPKAEVKKLIHNLSVSPRVTPAQARKNDETEYGLSHRCEIKYERNSSEKLLNETKNKPDTDAVFCKDVQSDDDIIIIDEEDLNVPKGDKPLINAKPVKDIENPILDFSIDEKSDQSNLKIKHSSSFEGLKMSDDLKQSILGEKKLIIEQKTEDSKLTCKTAPHKSELNTEILNSEKPKLLDTKTSETPTVLLSSLDQDIATKNVLVNEDQTPQKSIVSDTQKVDKKPSFNLQETLTFSCDIDNQPSKSQIEQTDSKDLKHEIKLENKHSSELVKPDFDLDRISISRGSSCVFVLGDLSSADEGKCEVTMLRSSDKKLITDTDETNQRENKKPFDNLRNLEEKDFLKPSSNFSTSKQNDINEKKPATTKADKKVEFVGEVEKLKLESKINSEVPVKSIELPISSESKTERTYHGNKTENISVTGKVKNTSHANKIGSTSQTSTNISTKTEKYFTPESNLKNPYSSSLKTTSTAKVKFSTTGSVISKPTSKGKLTQPVTSRYNSDFKRDSSIKDDVASTLEKYKKTPKEKTDLSEMASKRLFESKSDKKKDDKAKKEKTESKDDKIQNNKEVSNKTKSGNEAKKTQAGVISSLLKWGKKKDISLDQNKTSLKESSKKSDKKTELKNTTSEGSTKSKKVSTISVLPKLETKTSKTADLAKKNDSEKETTSKKEKARFSLWNFGSIRKVASQQ